MSCAMALTQSPQSPERVNEPFLPRIPGGLSQAAAAQPVQDGQSGNPKGRPKASESFARLARQTLNERIVIKENGERRTITKLQAALKQLINKAASGDARAIREVFKLQAMIAEHDKSTDEKVIVN